MVIFLLSAGTIALVMGVGYTIHDFAIFRRETVRQLRTLGEVIASNSTAALAFNSREDGEQILAALAADPRIEAAALYTERGELFARYPAKLDTKALPQRVMDEGQWSEDDGVASVLAVTRSGKRLGTLYLRASLAPIYERLRLHSGAVFVVIVAAVGVGALLSRALNRQISAPILDLAQTAQAISERQDYSVRAVKQGADEVGVLTDAFNAMLGQIQRLNRELEQRVAERTAELQAANQELEAFSYSVSHDLRAPVRHIAGFATLLEGHLGDAADEKTRRYTKIVRESAGRMGQLIDDLLAFSKTGRAELRRTPVALDELVAEVRRMLQADVAGRTMEWRVARLPVVYGDEGLLRQVFVNLLGNAVKYTRKRERAVIEVGTLPSEGAGATVWVRDNGAGFDMKYADKLFGVFERLHHANDFEGTGVGLATVKRIVQRHGGKVWAEARPNEGATFFVNLPVPARSVVPKRELNAISS